jgi:hypothetical protein
MITDYESRYQGMTEDYIESQPNDTREINVKMIDNIVFDGIDRKDYPDFADAFVVSADMNGHPMTSGS